MHSKQTLQVIQYPSWWRFYKAHLRTKQQNKEDETLPEDFVKTKASSYYGSVKVSDSKKNF